MNITGLIALFIGGAFAAIVFGYVMVKGRMPRLLRRRRGRPMRRQWT